jgi:multidrug efflux pump subunit AcrA (membrane-fusion protein)
MASKDLKPKTRLGGSHPGRVKAAVWTIVLLGFGGGGYAAFRYTGTTEVEVPVARVRRADFVVSVRTRGDIKSARSTILKAPQVPGLRITKLAANGRPVSKGDVVVEFDAVSQEQMVIARMNRVQAVDGDIVQMKATHKMNAEQDAMLKMQSEYALERAKLDASKAEVLSAIEGEKNRIQVGVAEGALQQVKAQINAHEVGNEADLGRIGQSKDKAARDLATTQRYLSLMQLRAPSDGVVNVMPNFRAQGTFGQSQPPFKEGDNAWTGAEIVEIPDLSQLYIDLRLEEVDRGRIQLGQTVTIRVDAIPDKEFTAELDYVSPIAALIFKGGSTPEKTFPARATLKSLDPRLRPGMSASAEIVIERQQNQLMIPAQASFDKDGKPAVYLQIGKNFVVREVQIGKRNDSDLVITGGLKEGDLVTLESPAEAAKKAKKKL